MTDLIEYLEYKDIALVGNAKSIFNKPRNIDKHDIVIRLNRGNPKGKETMIGSRTDVLVLSLNMNKKEMDDFNSKYFFYCSPLNREYLNAHLRESCYYYPTLNWQVLHKTLDARPSTGCMMFDFLWHYVDYFSLNLYGFDFMKTPNWQTEELHIGPHNYKHEEFYVRILANQDKRIIIHE